VSAAPTPAAKRVSAKRRTATLGTIRESKRGSIALDSGYVSAIAALAGSSIGAFATFATTWLNQSYQNRVQRHSNERARREKLYGDFINESAIAYTDAMANKLENPSTLVNLYALKSRISLFSNDDVLQEADKVLSAIASRYFEGNIKYSEMDPSYVSNFDLLREFTKACRRDMMRF
jgi:hypothetical protein